MKNSDYWTLIYDDKFKLELTGKEICKLLELIKKDLCKEVLCFENPSMLDELGMELFTIVHDENMKKRGIKIYE